MQTPKRSPDVCAADNGNRAAGSILKRADIAPLRSKPLRGTRFIGEKYSFRSFVDNLSLWQARHSDAQNALQHVFRA